MNGIEISICAAFALGMAVILYALHRRHQWLAERGFVDDGKASGGGSFVLLRELIEPSAQHIKHVNEEHPQHAEKEAPGERAAWLTGVG